MASSRSRNPLKRYRITIWCVGGMIALCYFSMTMLKSPQIAMAIAPLAVILIGMRSRSVLRAALGGAVMGLLAGATIVLTMQSMTVRGAMARYARSSTQPSAATQPKPSAAPTKPATTQPASQPSTNPATQPALSPDDIRKLTVFWAKKIIPATVFMCTAVAALFAYTASKRRRRIEKEWLS